MNPSSQVRRVLIIPIGTGELLQESISFLEIVLQFGGEFEELLILSFKARVLQPECLPLRPLPHQFLRVLLQSRDCLEDVALDEGGSTFNLGIEDATLAGHLRHLLATLLHPR